MLPAIRLGAPAAFLASDGDWRLLAVSADGALRLWDLRTLRLELETSVEPLLSGAPPGIRGASLPPLSPSSRVEQPSLPSPATPALSLQRGEECVSRSVCDAV